MSNPEIVHLYLESFCMNDFDTLKKILHPDLDFSGPFLQSATAAHYIDQLRQDPVKECRIEVLQLFENTNRVCVVYELIKPEITAQMVQLFTLKDRLITATELFFDSEKFLTLK